MSNRIRYLVQATAIVAYTFALLAHAGDLQQNAGQLDTSFGGSGFVVSAASGPLPSQTRTAVAVQPDGKYVVATTCGVAFTDFCVFRLTTGGSLDASFTGGDPAQPGNGKVVIPMGDGSSGATAVLLKRDGRIVVAGYCERFGQRTFCVAQLNRDGSLDASFDGPDSKQPGNGRVVLPAAQSALPDRFLVGAALLPDEHILLFGYCYQGDASVASHFCLARLKPDGSFDASFNGPPTALPGSGQFSLHLGSDANIATSVALTRDDGIVVAGYCKASNTAPEICLARLTDTGALDTSFAGNVGRPGEARLRIGGFATAAHAVRVQADGKIVVAGDCVVGAWLQICAARLLTNGVPDDTFAADGKLQVTTDFTHASVAAIALQDDGKLVLSGTCASAEQTRICLMRLQTDGSSDSAFDGGGGDGNGLFMLDRVTAADRNSAVALLPDGRIIVTGACSGLSGDELCIARLHGGPFAAQRCSFDLDGDGIVTAQVDLLLLMRIARGVRGDAVSQGIQFPAAATRRGWQALHAHLTNQCGLVLAL